MVNGMRLHHKRFVHGVGVLHMSLNPLGHKVSSTRWVIVYGALCGVDHPIICDTAKVSS